MTHKQQVPVTRSSRIVTFTVAALLTAIVAATYWSALGVLVERWYGDPEYIHCFLVPVFAAVLLWHRRAMVGQGAMPRTPGMERGAWPSPPINLPRDGGWREASGGSC